MEPTLSLNTCNNTAPAIPAAASRTSQLCKPLAAILKDTEAGSTLSVLEYFIQYMEEKDALHLLQFWFAVESFKTATPSPTDCSRQLTTSAYTTGHTDKQCDTASVETGHMTQQQTVTEKGSTNPEYKVLNRTQDSALSPNNDAHDQTVTAAAVTNTSENEGTRQCINNNIEGRKNMRSTNSDTLQGQRALEQPAAAALSQLGDAIMTVPQNSATEGIHVHHQRVLKQLSLSEEPCIWCL